MEKLKAIVSGIDQLTPEAEVLLSSFASIKYKTPKTIDELISALQLCDIFWLRLNHNLTREILSKATCKYILCAVTGLDHIDSKACEDLGIKVISLKGETEFLKEVRATAEHTILLMLAILRKAKDAFIHPDLGNWNRYLFQGRELYKKKIGILGLGRLGAIVAQYATVFGMEVYYYDNYNHDESYIKCNSLNELISSVDILSIHLPYSDDTHQILSKDVLKSINKPIYIVNTSRGGIVNEGDLLDAINKGLVLGYATDVLYKEPNVENNPILEFSKTSDKVIITPHIGGNTYESIEKTELFIAQKLIDIIS